MKFYPRRVIVLKMWRRLFSKVISLLNLLYEVTIELTFYIIYQQRAVDLGYTEPDARDDLSGVDVQRKAGLVCVSI